MTNTKAIVNSDFKPNKKHPLYFIRNGLYQAIKANQSYMVGRLLDFGCGQKPYKALFNDVTEYVGLDYYNEGHPHENEQIDFFYDGKKIPFEDESFDSVFCSEVFEHVFNLPEIMKELNRVLKINGKILITCPFVWNEHEIPNDYARYTQFSLKTIFEENGFKIIKFQKTGNFLTALYQMKIIYIKEHILPRVPTIIGKIIRHIYFPFLNNWYSLKLKILPNASDLYMNNVLVAEKMEKQ